MIISCKNDKIWWKYDDIYLVLNTCLLIGQNWYFGEIISQRFEIFVAKISTVPKGQKRVQSSLCQRVAVSFYDVNFKFILKWILFSRHCYRL